MDAPRDALIDTETLLAALRDQGEMLAATPPMALTESVPSVPDWTVEHVVRHTGKVHRWVLAALSAPAGTPLSEIRASGSLPRGPQCLDAYRDALDALLEAFANLDPAQPVPTMTGPGTAAWWLRRQTHEVSIHRIDVADTLRAAGGPSVPGLDPDVAADGVDEWAGVFLPGLAAGGRLPSVLDGRSIHLHGTDSPSAEWYFGFGPGRVSVAREHRRGDVALRGRAQDLLLTLWRRRPLERLDAVGDVAVAQALIESAAL